MIKQSKYKSLDLKDLGKGLLVAFGTTFLTGLAAVLDSNGLPTLAQIKVVSFAGVTAGITYLVKNLFTNSAGRLGKKELSK